MTKPTPFSARHSLGEQLLSEETTNAAGGLLQGGESRASASVSGIAPILLSQTVSGTAARTTIDLTFSTAMRAGTSGSIYITDGAVQTVLDSSGMPSLRIVGANDTREIALSAVNFSGEHVLIDGLDLLAGHHYSVVISPGALQSTGARAYAGVRSPGAISFSTAASGDTTGPTLDSVHLDATKLKAGQEILVTLTFSERIAPPDPAAFSTPHAELVDLHSDDGIVWYATLKAAAAVDAVGNAFAVDMSMIRDLAYNVGRGASPVATYDVDSMVAAWVVPYMWLQDDRGPDYTDRVSNGTTQDLSGAIMGRIESGQHFELRIGDLLIRSDSSDSITLADASEGSYSGYTWTYHGPVPDGVSTVLARVVDSAGHSSAEYSTTVHIDNTAPSMTSSADGSGSFSPTADVVINFSEATYWHASEGSGSMIQIRDGFGNASYVAFSLAQLSEDGRTLTIPASAHQFVAGLDYRIAMPLTLTDIAGNGIGEHYIRLHTAGTYVDNMAPRATSASVDTRAGSYGSGAIIDIRIVMNEDVKIVGATAPTLGLNNNATASFVSLVSPRELLFRYQVADHQDVPMLEVTNWTSLFGSVADLAGNLLDASHVEFTHLVNPTADSPATSGIEIDTTAPLKMAAPTLAEDTDSASKGDNVTSNDKPTLSGSGAEPGSAISLADGEGFVDIIYADSSGNWTYTFTEPLSNGIHRFSVRQQDSAGNRSPFSDSLNVTIDTAAAAPTLALDAASDTGTPGDHSTAVTSPTIKGSAEAGALVELYEGAAHVGSATADASGNWSIVTGTLAAGLHTLHAQQTDVAGNVSDPSENLLITIEGTGTPAVSLSAPVLDPDSDTGAKVDLITRDSTPRVTGSGATAGATVQLYDGSSVIGSAIADASGTWQVDIASALTDGSYLLTARQLDSAGTAVTASPSATITIDTAATAPTIALDINSDTGTANDNVTMLSAPMVKGVAEAGARVDVYDGTILLATTTADASGKWSATTAALGEGMHTLTAKQVDVAGNASADFASLTVTVDTTAPGALAAPGLATLSDSGTKGDRITNDSTPTVSGGGALAGAKVELFSGWTKVGSTTADASGNWSIDIGSVFMDGGYVMYAVQYDAAGNASAASPSETFYFDTLAAAPSMILDSLSDTGTPFDFRTADNTPTFRGSAEPNAHVKLYADGTLVGETDASDSGAWSIVSNAVLDGSRSFTAKQIDVAGNESTSTVPIALTIDTVAPTSSWSLSGGILALSFNEKVSTSGNVILKTSTGALVSTISPTDLQWHHSSSGPSQLEISGLQPGTYVVHFDSQPIDLVGNAAFVPDYTFRIDPPA